MSATVLLLIVIAIAVLSFAADTLTRYIPFEVEKSLASKVPIEGFADEIGPVQNYLQHLADNLSRQMDLPEGMTIKISVVNSDTINALATLGGNIVVFTGLLDSLPNENALAMVMAHEIAHVQLRHPLRALGRGVVVGIAIATLAGVTGNEMIDNLIGNTGTLTTISFTREQESAADQLAIEAVAKHYGHVGEASRLFEILSKKESLIGDKVPEFLSTHPHNEDRINAISQQAKQHGYEISGKVNDIPASVRKELDRLHTERKSDE